MAGKMIFVVRPETIHVDRTNTQETILAPCKSQPCSLYRTAGLSHLYSFQMRTECIPCRCPHDIVHVDNQCNEIESVRPSTYRECTPSSGLVLDRPGKNPEGIHCSDQEEQCCCVRILQGKFDTNLCYCRACQQHIACTTGLQFSSKT